MNRGRRHLGGVGVPRRARNVHCRADLVFRAGARTLTVATLAPGETPVTFTGTPGVAELIEPAPTARRNR